MSTVKGNSKATDCFGQKPKELQRRLQQRTFLPCCTNGGVWGHSKVIPYLGEEHWAVQAGLALP